MGRVGWVLPGTHQLPLHRRKGAESTPRLIRWAGRDALYHSHGALYQSESVDSSEKTRRWLLLLRHNWTQLILIRRFLSPLAISVKLRAASRCCGTFYRKSCHSLLFWSVTPFWYLTNWWWPAYPPLSFVRRPETNHVPEWPPTFLRACLFHYTLILWPQRTIMLSGPRRLQFLPR